LLKRTKPTTVHVESIQPWVDEANSKKLAKISFVDFSIEILINQLAKDIECLVLKHTRITLFCYSM